MVVVAIAAGPSVLLVDDDAKLGLLLTEYLGRFGISLQCVTDPVVGIRQIKQDLPDLVVLDVMLPRMSGFDVCREVRGFSRVPIIMLTARGELTDRVIGLEMGADDYLAKPFEPRELVARIQAVLRRRPALDSGDELIRSGDIEINMPGRIASRDGQPLALTSAEFDLLALLVKQRGRVLTRDRILEETRRTDGESFDRAIDVMISRLRQKLGDHAKHPSYIKTVRGTGYCFTGGVHE